MWQLDDRHIGLAQQMSKHTWITKMAQAMNGRKAIIWACPEAKTTAGFDAAARQSGHPAAVPAVINGGVS